MVVSDTNIVSLDWRKIMFDKYGNDLDYWYYCPICGRSLLPSFNTCVKHKNVKLVKSLHEKEYYEKILKERKDYISSGFKIVEEEEIIKNPLYNPKSAESSKKEKASKKPNSSKSNLIYCLIAAFVCLLLVGWTLNMFKSNDDRSSDAWVCAEEVVRQNLKSPSSAKFCTYPEATIKDKGNNEYMITGWVDADNSFGASVRTDFTVTLTLTEKGYKDAECYFDDDSIYAIAQDIVEENGLDDSKNDSMKEYISRLIDEEYADKSTESETEKEIVIPEEYQNLVLMDDVIWNYTNYLGKTKEETGFDEIEPSNNLGTSYKLENANFLETECNIWLYFDGDVAERIYIEFPADFGNSIGYIDSRFKAILQYTIGTAIYDETEHSYKIDIPDSDLIICGDDTSSLYQRIDIVKH